MVRRGLFFLLCGTLLFVPLALSQSTNATLSGRVSDPTGAAVAGAKVGAESVESGVNYGTETNSAGFYQVAVPPGKYRMIVTKDGFSRLVKPDIQLHIQDEVGLNFDLQVGSVAQSVTVEGGAPLVNTESGAVSTVVDRQFTENIPLNGRSFQSLIEMVPGVTVAAGAQVGFHGEFSVNGQRTEANYYMVDGVAANTGIFPGSAAYGGGQYPAETALGTMQSLISVDAMEEFRINTSTYSAEFGRTPGAQVSIQTRPGTNTWHGSAFDYFRNDALDANNWFNDASRLAKTPERQNDFGGTFGGPVHVPGIYNGKDKTFFFFSYEGMRLTIPQAASTFWVPDLTLRQTAPTVVRPLLNAFPVPNGAEQTNDFALFTGVYSAPSTLNATSVRIDQTLGSKWRLFGFFGDTPSVSTTRMSANLAIRTDTSFDLKRFTLGATALLSPRLSNDLRFNGTWNGSNILESQDNFGGATALPPAQLFSTPLLPGYQFSTLFEFGTIPRLAALTMQNPQQQWSVVDAFSAAFGPHMLKFGFDYRRIATTQVSNQITGTYVYFTLPQILSNAAQVVNASTFGAAAPVLIFSNYSSFVQDEWRATKRLHLSLGLRWDVNPPPINGNGPLPYTLNQVTNLATASLAPQNTPLWNTDWHGFAPRFGFAYQLHSSSTHQTVLRGGAGLFYDLGTNFAGYGVNGIGFSVTNTYANTAFPLTPQQATFAPASVTPPYKALVAAADPNLVLPKVWEWNVSVEQGLGANQALTVSFVGAAGSDLLAARYLLLNSINPNFTSSAPLYLVTNAASSNYDALQVQFQRRLTHGLQALASYTWGHSIDDLSQNYSSTTPPVRGNSDFDIRHTFSGALTYAIPTRSSNRFANGVVGGWSLDTRVIARSALPFSVSSGTSYLGGTVMTALLPNLVPGVPIYVSNPTAPGGRVVNLAAFAAAPAGTDGNAPRNFLRAFDLWQTDLALHKDFPLHERLRLQVRAESFNLFNHPNFGTIQNLLTAGPTLFGRATGTLNTQLGGLNPLYQTGGPRSLQMALKLIF